MHEPSRQQRGRNFSRLGLFSCVSLSISSIFSSTIFPENIRNYKSQNLARLTSTSSKFFLFLSTLSHILLFSVIPFSFPWHPLCQICSNVSFYRNGVLSPRLWTFSVIFDASELLSNLKFSRVFNETFFSVRYLKFLSFVEKFHWDWVVFLSSRILVLGNTARSLLPFSL